MRRAEDGLSGKQPTWTRQDGHYVCKSSFEDDSGKTHRLIAIVDQVGELWMNRVYLDDIIIDQGEWDGRRVALHNARNAMRRAYQQRVITQFSKDPEPDEYE